MRSDTMPVVHRASKSSRLPSLDGIRAICITMVIGAHAAQSIGFPQSWKSVTPYLFDGHLGVLAFFVLSGFLITWLLVKEESSTSQISLREFYMRRVLRILPVYFAYVGMMAILHFSTGLSIDSCGFATTVTFTKNYACSQWIDGHLWSLSVEEQFYLLWPLTLVLLKGDRRILAGILLVLAAPLIRAVFLAYFDFKVVRQSLPTNVDSLMVGSLLGIALNRWPRRLEVVLNWRPTLGRALSLSAIYAAWMVDLHGTFLPYSISYVKSVQAIGVGYLIASYAVVHSGVGFRILNLGILSYTGFLSYSLYIWQQPFFDRDAHTWLGQWSIPASFPWNVVASVCVAMISFHALEKPLMKLRARFRPLAEEVSTHATESRASQSTVSNRGSVSHG